MTRVEETEINYELIRQIPEFKHLSASSFVEWYHTLLEEIEQCKTVDDRKFKENEISTIRKLICSKYAMNNGDYLIKYPESLFKLIKLRLFQPLYSLLEGYGKKYNVTVFNYDNLDKAKERQQPILFVSNMSTSGVIPLIKKATNMQITFPFSNNEDGLTPKKIKNILSRGGYLYDKNNKSSIIEAEEYLTSMLAKGSNGLLLPNETLESTVEYPQLSMEWDIAEIAKNSRAVIMPIAVDAFNGEFYTNLSEPISVSVFDSNLAIYENVRDVLAYSRQEIWDNLENDSRSKKKVL